MNAARAEHRRRLAADLPIMNVDNVFEAVQERTASRCDIIVIGKPHTKDTTATPSIVVPPSDWPQHFRLLLLSEQGVDARFLVGGQTFVVHRCVLSLFGAMREGTATQDYIQIDDMIPQVFKTLLHFIYTDTLPETEGEDEAASPAMAEHLLAITH
uniref:BTB domain-containing protein n=1 Tax=Setaria viridis TaxID=4556 RepID=A0A4U6SZJ8_SETVI|nr:LOW QUALITY PROTEIN: hypothetical protein SEVIR_9G249600v2 [Setaria viridis]